MTDVIIQHLITEQKGMLVQAILLNYKWMNLDQAFLARHWKLAIQKACFSIKL